MESAMIEHFNGYTCTCTSKLYELSTYFIVKSYVNKVVLYDKSIIQNELGYSINNNNFKKAKVKI